MWLPHAWTKIPRWNLCRIQDSKYADYVFLSWSQLRCCLLCLRCPPLWKASGDSTQTDHRRPRRPEWGGKTRSFWMSVLRCSETFGWWNMVVFQTILYCNEILSFQVWFPTERSKAEKQRLTLKKSKREKKMVGKMETMLEQQRTEEEKRNQKKEAGYPNISTPWKTSPNPNLALESTLYLKVCVFIKETASWISWHISSWMRRWGVAGVALRELLSSCDRNRPNLTFLVSL